MKLQFHANQQLQLDAVAAVVDVFDGQPRSTGDQLVVNAPDANDPFNRIEQTGPSWNRVARRRASISRCCEPMPTGQCVPQADRGRKAILPGLKPAVAA